MMAHKAPGKAHRKGITLIELGRMFPDEDSARQWFEDHLWPDGVRGCPKCGSIDTYACKHVKMPYRCRDCGAYFSVRTGTVMQKSPLPLLTWLYAIYLDLTSLKGVSSMKLHRDLGIRQATAWHMLQRIREAFAYEGPEVVFKGPAEVDETYFGGRRKNMSNAKRKALADAGLGRGPSGKVAVVGVKDRKTKRVAAKVVTRTDGETLQGFVREHVEAGSTVYTDEASAYEGLHDFRHESVKHSVSEYVRGRAHTNGVESFWSMLKRAHKGTFHKISPKHLQRYVNEFAGRQNIREDDTLEQMGHVTTAMAGKRLQYRELIADNGLESGARQ